MFSGCVRNYDGVFGGVFTLAALVATTFVIVVWEE